MHTNDTFGSNTDWTPNNSCFDGCPNQSSKLFKLIFKREKTVGKIRTQKSYAKIFKLCQLQGRLVLLRAVNIADN
jgi:hypothetical protein